MVGASHPLATAAAALVVLVAMAAAAAPGSHCNATCGDVPVPYPFGFQPECYLPGFNLTCDTTSRHGPPRLLFGDGSLRVVDIFPQNASLRVLHEGSMVNGTFTANSRLPNVTSASILVNAPFTFSFILNELFLFGCDVMATLVIASGIRGADGSRPEIAGCVSDCSRSRRLGIRGGGGTQHSHYCSGSGDGCCRVTLTYSTTADWHVPIEFQLVPLEGRNNSDLDSSRVSVFLAEKGWMEKGQISEPKNDIPIIMRWDAMQGLSLSDDDRNESDTGNGQRCPRSVCRSNNSECTRDAEVSLLCQCKKGYDGNPYLDNGCQDIDECKNPLISEHCFGDCTNTDGSYECRCRSGYFGNATIRGGCFKTARSITPSTIALLASSGPALLLLIFGAVFVLRKLKQHRRKLLRLKYFKQNRGQLLQQLVSQRADIAERMIITVDELAKATNNFDRARELGGGAHGTVYKGILSDQHVVAIKKSKITVQREINEFINEVAILSQVNHRNVVKLLGCCLETEVPLLVYEFISNGTLYHHLHVEGPISLSWRNRLRIAKETANALAYLHSSVAVPVIHRDIKSSNILLDDALTAKVSDFGASRYIPVENTGVTSVVQGTIGYLDPMCFYTGRLNDKSDVYSFGVILMELLTRKKPFSYLSSDGDGLVMHFVNLHGEGNLCQILDPQVKDEGGKEVEEIATIATLCVKMGSEDERPTMRQVEHTLEGLLASVKSSNDHILEVEEIDEENVNILREMQSPEESSRRYSMEREIMMSARYPR